MAEKFGFGFSDDDYATGGFTQGRLKVTKMWAGTPPARKAGSGETPFCVVLDGVDAAGNKQSVWLTLGGDAKTSREKWKTVDGGRSFVPRKEGLRLGSSCKWSVFRESLKQVEFPMSRLALPDGYFGMNGVTLDINSRAMQLSDDIKADRNKAGQKAALEFFVTAFQLPDGGAAAEDGEDDEVEAKSAEDELKAYLAKALAKAGEPVVISVLKADMVKKYEKDERVDEMTTLLKLAWCEANGFVVDRAAKTVAAADAD